MPRSALEIAACRLLTELLGEEANKSSPAAVPFQDDEENHNSVMEIGYIVRKNTILSKMGEMYLDALKRYLDIRE